MLLCKILPLLTKSLFFATAQPMLKITAYNKFPMTNVLRVKEHSKTIFRGIWHAHEKALVFVLENMLYNIMRSYCYCHCTFSMSKNWMAMMNQNYQAEKLLKRLQNNPIKNHVKIKKIPKNTHVAFPFWLLHSSVIILADALAQAYILVRISTGTPLSFLP